MSTTSIADDSNNRPQHVAQSTDQESFVVYGYPCSLPDHNTSHPNPAAAHAAGTVYPLAVDGTAQSNSVRLAEAKEDLVILKNVVCGIIIIIILLFFMVKTLMENSQTHNPKIHIHSALLSPFTVINSQKSAKCETGILLKNPNWLAGIGYENFQQSLFYKTEYLSGTIVSPVHQPPRGQTLLTVSTQVLPQHINSTTASFIDLDIAHGRIGFDVKLTAIITNGRTFLTGKKIRMIDALCRGVEIQFSANAINGTMQGGPRPCMVKVYAYLKN